MIAFLFKNEFVTSQEDTNAHFFQDNLLGFAEV